MSRLNLVYIIDDEEVDILIARHCISQVVPKAHLCPFASVTCALESLQQALTQTQTLPDLLFVDINMPVIDGWEFLEWYGLHIKPVIQKGIVYLLTSSIHVADKDKAKTYPWVKDILTKPFSIDMMKKIVDNHFCT